MATRSDQKFRYGTREDILRRGTGIGGEVAVSQGKMELRELEIALNTVGDTGGQNLKQTVDDIVSLVRGPLSRYILEMGRFINDQGEVSRLAQVLMDDLETSGTSDSDAIHDNVASEISAITEKASPVGADLLVIEDSAAGNVKKRLQITNLPAGGEVNDLSASVTWANIPDANVPQSAVTQHQGALSVTESQVSDLQSYLTAETNDLSAAVTWANIPDANVPASAVTQHEGAIDHDALTNFAAGEHRIINDAGTSATEIWSASKVNTELGGKSDTGHTHTESDITDLGSYIEASGVTYGNLDANADVGTGATQVAQGDHTHGQLHDAVTLAGTPDYITLSGQVLTRNDVDLANDVTGNLPVSNLNSGTGATSSTFWRGDGTWVAPSGGSGISEYMYPVWAEENAALGASNTYEWAYGNGANTPSDGGITIYVPSGWTCEVVAMSLRVGGGTATVELVKNGTPQGSSANVVLSSGQSATNELGTPLSLANNDYINFRTTSSSGTSSPCVVTAWIKMTET